MRIGVLIRIRQSFSQSKVGKLALIVDRWGLCSATIQIIDTGETVEFDIRKLEAICQQKI